MARALIFILFLTLTGLFALINWTAFSAPTTLSLGLTTVEAPLGLIMLGLLVLLCIAFSAWAITLQGQALMDARRLGKDLQAQRELADKAEASRFTELRSHLDSAIAGVQRSVEQQGNSVAASLAELEDRLERGGLAAAPTGSRGSLPAPYQGS